MTVPLSTYTKFSKKVTFLTGVPVHISGGKKC